MSGVFGVAYGMGVDSTAVLIGLAARRVRPDFILFADVGFEKDATNAYLSIINEWLRARRWPEVTVVRYKTVKAPYSTLEGNLAMNATLPGATFGRGSCTMKWKIDPQNRWSAANPSCRAAWAAGNKVTKAIGFDASEGYRCSRASDKAHTADERFAYTYPLQDWGWDREECKARIREAGLPVPPNSACLCCPNCKPAEILDLSVEERGRVARVELMTAPYNKKVHDLWRRPRKADGRPGSITEFMLREKILFTHPAHLPDEMPLNPACAKGRHGWTFEPPHEALDLAPMLAEAENTMHWGVANGMADLFHAAA